VVDFFSCAFVLVGSGLATRDVRRLDVVFLRDVRFFGAVLRDVFRGAFFLLRDVRRFFLGADLFVNFRSSASRRLAAGFAMIRLVLVRRADIRAPPELRRAMRS
jgi:hypothetical protein